MKLQFGMLFIAACAGATPSPAQEVGVKTDLEKQKNCVTAAKTYAEADACTNKVRDTRPIPVYPDGGK